MAGTVGLLVAPRLRLSPSSYPAAAVTALLASVPCQFCFGLLVEHALGLSRPPMLPAATAATAATSCPLIGLPGTRMLPLLLLLLLLPLVGGGAATVAAGGESERLVVAVRAAAVVGVGGG